MLRSTLVFAMCALFFAGCHNSSSHHGPPIVVSPPEFFFSADYIGETTKEVYYWDSSFDQAFVEFEAFDFDGLFTIEVYDDFGDLVYLRTHNGSGGYRYELDETDLGFDGEWVIIIETFDAFGHVDVLLY